MIESSVGDEGLSGSREELSRTGRLDSRKRRGGSGRLGRQLHGSELRENDLSIGQGTRGSGGPIGRAVVGRLLREGRIGGIVRFWPRTSNWSGRHRRGDVLDDPIRRS